VDPAAIPPSDALGGGAAQGGGRGPFCRLAVALLSLANAFSLSCRPPLPGPDRLVVSTAPAPSEAERYCAWYGSARGGVLYFGESAFWWAMRRASGDPGADLLEPGPQRIGRFDLTARRLLPPLEVGPPDSRSGVWDVLAHPNGRVYFTTYFEESGFVDPETGRVVRLGAGSVGWNELAPGPDGGVIVSRYGNPGGAPGAVVVLDAEGAVRAEIPLAGPDGYLVAPKTVAWDPRRGEVWATADLLPAARADLVQRRDAFVVAIDGQSSQRWGGGPGEPELQFVRFDADGTGQAAVARGERLELVALSPGVGLAGLDSAPRVLLDGAFAPTHDFAQDVQPAPGGGAVVARWSGRVHVVDGDGRVRSLRLPALEEGGLYYTAVVAGEMLCATYCAEVTVVCRAAPR
jgi:hypothetical protein